MNFFADSIFPFIFMCKNFQFFPIKENEISPASTHCRHCPLLLPATKCTSCRCVLMLPHHLFLPSPEAALLEDRDDFLVARSLGPSPALIQSTSSEALEKWSSSQFLLPSFWFFASLGEFFSVTLVKSSFSKSPFKCVYSQSSTLTLVHLFVILGSFSISPAILSMSSHLWSADS